MNMKSLIALTALTAAGAASAEVISGNTLCRIEVDSGAASTIVAVPLVKIGDGSAIPVTELVLTNNLTVGDTILHYNASKKWDAWVITENSGVKTWTPTVISVGSNNSTTEPAAGTALARGDAIWVNRAVTNEPFYVYGQVAGSSATAATSTVEKGGADTPEYTMLSAPTTDPAGFQLNTLVGKKASENGGAFADGDTIVVVDSSNAQFGRKEYVYKSSERQFCTLTVTTSKITIGGVEYTSVTGQSWTPVPDTVKIPVGEGFWYVSKGGDPKIEW